jgi:cyanate permease
MITALHMSPLLAQVGSGRIQGGWEYIWAAYLIAWACLSLYALSLWLRRPGQATNDSKE